MGSTDRKQLYLDTALPFVGCAHTFMSSHLVPGVRRWQIVVFAGAVVCYWIALYLYVPTLPIYVKQFSSDLRLVGIVLSMYGLWQAVTRFPVGLAADWWGQNRPFLLIGFVFTALGPWILSIAPDITWLGVGRAITGLAATTWVPIVVVFSRFFLPSQTIRALAILTMIGSCGRILATSVNGLLNNLGGYALAFRGAVLMASIAILLILFVPERKRPLQPQPLGSIRSLLTRPHVLCPALLNALAQLVNFGLTFGFMPILAQNLGADGVQVSLLVTLNMVFNMLGNTMTATLVHSLGPRRLVRAEFLLLGLGSLLAGLAPHLGWLYIAQACIGLATGMGYPTLMGLSIRYVSDHERTGAMGLHQGIYGFGMFSGPFVCGFLADWFGIPTTFVLLAGVCLGVLLPGLPGRLLLAATTET